jgi:hypothetical protein
LSIFVKKRKPFSIFRSAMFPDPEHHIPRIPRAAPPSP